jgi:hypothetical protein
MQRQRREAVILAVVFSFISLTHILCRVVTVCYRGATDWTVWRWNITPSDVDKVPSRLWDWKDAQCGIGRMHSFFGASCDIPARPTPMAKYDNPSLSADFMETSGLESGMWATQ